VAWETGGPIDLLPAPVFAVADPFDGTPLNDPTRWNTLPDPDDPGSPFYAFTCFTRAFDPAHPRASAFARHGMPFLVFDAEEAPTNPEETLRARVVSMGSDRVYGHLFSDARFTTPTPADLSIATDPSSDDYGRFVHR